MTVGNEIEVKIRLDDRTAVGERLRQAGFTISAPRQFEANTLYDTAERTLAQKGMLLRLRQIGEKAVITWKGSGAEAVYKSRPELETSIGSVETIEQILGKLGYRASFRYEKFRTEFRAREGGGGVVTIDETPIGDFLELEGEGAWIDETAQRLGFSRADYVLASYGRLYLADCERRGMEPADMIFASHA